MTTHSVSEWMPLLVPDMPSPQSLLPWLERMHASKHYSNFGPLVRMLEAEFAQRFSLSIDQVTTVANATQGLELALQALDLSPGARVLLPTFTFVASATAVLQAGFVPVLADVDPHSWMLTPEIARRACADTHIDVVLTVAALGMPHDMRAWAQFELDTGLPVVVDAAAAYGSQWLPQGVLGTLIFSLHTTKSLPAGEGGLVISNRPGFISRVRQLSNFGINLDLAAEIPVGALANIGTNAKMSEYHAAIALEMLKSWDVFALQRRVLLTELQEELSRVSDGGVNWQCEGAGGALMSPTLLCVRLPSGVMREKLQLICEDLKISTRRWYQPLLHKMDALMSRSILLDTPVADELADTLIGLPFFREMSFPQKQLLRDAMKFTFKG